MTVELVRSKKQTANFDDASNYVLDSLSALSDTFERFMWASHNTGLLVSYLSLDTRTALTSLPTDDMAGTQKKIARLCKKIDGFAGDLGDGALMFNKLPKLILNQFAGEIDLFKSRNNRTRKPLDPTR